MCVWVSLHLSGSVNVLVNTKEKDKSCLFLILSEPFDLSLLVLAAAWLFFLICKLQSQSEVKTLDKDRITKTTVTGVCDGKKQRSWTVEYCPVYGHSRGGNYLPLGHNISWSEHLMSLSRPGNVSHREMKGTATYRRTWHSLAILARGAIWK